MVYPLILMSINVKKCEVTKVTCPPNLSGKGIKSSGKYDNKKEYVCDSGCCKSRW